MRAALLSEWPALSSHFPFLNPLTVGRFSAEEIAQFRESIAERRWHGNG